MKYVRRYKHVHNLKRKHKKTPACKNRRTYSFSTLLRAIRSFDKRKIAMTLLDNARNAYSKMYGDDKNVIYCADCDYYYDVEDNGQVYHECGKEGTQPEPTHTCLFAVRRAEWRKK